MAKPKQRVLITGSSDGGLGAALAIAFHSAGYIVFATARNPAKMQHLTSLGIETLTLDVQSQASIQGCISKVSALDILVNNAGGQYPIPVADMDISEAKNLFDLNVWSQIAMTQACLPLLLRSPGGMIVNQTSIAAVTTVPFQAVYNASKAAAATFSDTLRLELEAFGIRVVDLRTGLVSTNLHRNALESGRSHLPQGSIYQPAREVVEKSLRLEHFEDQGTPAQVWADTVVQDLSKEHPPSVIWRGNQAGTVRLATFLPAGMLDGATKRMTGLHQAEKLLKKRES